MKQGIAMSKNAKNIRKKKQSNVGKRPLWSEIDARERTANKTKKLQCSSETEPIPSPRARHLTERCARVKKKRFSTTNPFDEKKLTLRTTGIRRTTAQTKRENRRRRVFLDIRPRSLDTA